MDCNQFVKLMKDFLDTPEPDDRRVRQVVEHLRNCRTCHETYQSVSEGKIPENIVPEPTKIKVDPSPPRQGSDIFDPVEFKDKPITFTLLLDDREEPIKVVETDFDTPIPDKSRLVVNDGNVCIADVQFSFKPEREQPYTLHFRVRHRMRYRPPEVFSFGPPGENMQQFFKKTIVDEGGICADIEMTRGKARLHIRFKPG